MIPRFGGALCVLKFV